MDELLYKELSYKVQGAFFEVYKHLGNAHKEIVYQNALLEEFKDRNVNAITQKRLGVYFKDKKVGTYIPDIVIENLIIIEIKSKPRIIPNDTQQFWHYLRNSEYKLGYLVNFGSNEKVEFIRRIYDTARQKI